MPRTLRQAIPFEELAANMQNDAASRRKNRYSRKDVFISEADATERGAILAAITAILGVIGCCLGLWATYMALGNAEARGGHIYAKSEMSRSEVKALNVMPVKSELRRGR